MRTTSLLSIATLALVLAAPLASVAIAGDHAGNQWREDNDNSRVTTSYVQANPALIQMETRAYQIDLNRQQLAQAPAVAPVANSGQSAVTVTK
jgi:hypothetical protein